MPTIHLTEKDNNSEITVATGDIIQLQLDETPTTGFKWEITTINNSQVSLLGEDYKIETATGIGGGGKKIFELKIIQAASGNLQLENRQPWSGEVYARFKISYKAA